MKRMQNMRTITNPLGFLANSQHQRIWCAFTNYRLSWASHAIPLSMMSYRGVFVGLNSPLSLAIQVFGSKMRLALLGFLANPQLSIDLVYIYQLLFKLG